jgi:uncharacterized OB-fold protein
MTYLKPLPQIEPRNKEFWDGLAAGEFRVPKCDDCGHYNWVPYPACRSCLSENQTWTPVSRDATVWSYSVVHRGPGAFNADVPYAVVLAKLAEEPRGCIVLGNTVGIDPADLYVGMPLRIVFEEIPGEDVTVYRFAAAGSPEAAEPDDADAALDADNQPATVA